MPFTTTKQLNTVLTLLGENLFNSMHLFAACPNFLHLLHLKGGPLAVGVDLSLDERIAHSSSDNSIASERFNSPLLRTVV
jgi:hypothetical protein